MTIRYICDTLCVWKYDNIISFWKKKMEDNWKKYVYNFHYKRSEQTYLKYIIYFAYYKSTLKENSFILRIVKKNMYILHNTFTKIRFVPIHKL